MPFMLWVHRLNSTLCLLVGLPLNLLLVWLLFKRTSKEMRMYSQILAQTCVVDMLVLILGELVQPVFFVEQGVAQDLMVGPLRVLPNPANHIVFMLWFAAFYFSTEGLAVQFIYRYLTICRKIPMNAPKYFGLLAVAFLLEMVLAVTLSISSYPDKDHQQIVDSEMLGALDNNDDVNSDDNDNATSLSVVDGAEKWTLSLRGDTRDPSVVGFFLLLFIFNTVTYALIVFCATRIRAFLRRQFVEYKLSKWSELNGQITKTLMIQSMLPAVPLLMCTFGVISALFAPPSSNAVATVEMLITVPLCWLPVANPLVTIVTVKHYRKIVQGAGKKVASLLMVASKSPSPTTKTNLSFK